MGAPRLFFIRPRSHRGRFLDRIVCVLSDARSPVSCLHLLSTRCEFQARLVARRVHHLYNAPHLGVSVLARKQQRCHQQIGNVDGELGFLQLSTLIDYAELYPLI